MIGGNFRENGKKSGRKYGRKKIWEKIVGKGIWLKGEEGEKIGGARVFSTRAHQK